MKIALCLEYPIDQHGGVEVLVSELIRGLARKHQVWLVSAESDDSARNSAVGHLLAGHLPWHPAAVSVKQSGELAQGLLKAGVELAHFHFGGNYGWGNRAFRQCPIVHACQNGIPCLSTNHGAFSIMEGFCGPQRSFFFKSLLFPPAWLSKQYVLAHLRCEVAVSQFDYRALRRWYPPMRRKFRWIYHSRLHAPPPPENLQREKVILCAGTIGLRKGQPLLAEAFSRIAKKFPDWQVVFVGRNGDEAVLRQIQQLVAANGLERQVKLMGPCSDDELRAWLQRAAIFAMPSTYEGLGLSLQEAQFYGCACVATRCGGTVDLIDDGQDGLLVPVGEPAPLADALERLITDEALRTRFARRAPRSVLEKGMTTDRMVAAYEQLYTEMLKPSSTAA